MDETVFIVQLRKEECVGSGDGDGEGESGCSAGA